MPIIITDSVGLMVMYLMMAGVVLSRVALGLLVVLTQGVSCTYRLVFMPPWKVFKYCSHRFRLLNSFVQHSLTVYHKALR